MLHGSIRLSAGLGIRHPVFEVHVVQWLWLTPLYPQWHPLDYRATLAGVCGSLGAIACHVVQKRAMRSVRAYDRSEVAILLEVFLDFVLGKIVFNACDE